MRLLSGRHHAAQIADWAKSQGIRYRHDADGGIWSTVTALNAALGVLVPPDTGAYDDFEIQ